MKLSLLTLAFIFSYSTWSADKGGAKEASARAPASRTSFKAFQAGMNKWFKDNYDKLRNVDICVAMIDTNFSPEGVSYDLDISCTTRNAGTDPLHFVVLDFESGSHGYPYLILQDRMRSVSLKVEHMTEVAMGQVSRHSTYYFEPK